jgi:hypothetical protein
VVPGAWVGTEGIFEDIGKPVAVSVFPVVGRGSREEIREVLSEP